MRTEDEQEDSSSSWLQRLHQLEYTIGASISTPRAGRDINDTSEKKHEKGEKMKGERRNKEEGKRWKYG